MHVAFCRLSVYTLYFIVFFITHSQVDKRAMASNISSIRSIYLTLFSVSNVCDFAILLHMLYRFTKEPYNLACMCTFSNKNLCCIIPARLQMIFISFKVTFSQFYCFHCIQHGNWNGVTPNMLFLTLK